MIDLITGLPGNAKTLYTIAQVKAWSEREDRPVYYSGIAELTLPWTQIEPEKWAECPKRSIVVIDECQRIFRNRSLGTQPPKFVSDLETHRHLGIDLVFITQHPMLVDPSIRRLTGRHRHMVRVWGMEVSTVHEWGSVRDNCDKPAMRKDSEKTKWAFDKSVYKLYKSAEEHTMKRSIPFRVKVLLLLPLLLGAAGWYVYHFMNNKIHPVSVPGAVAVGSAVVGAPGAVAPRGKDVFDPVADAKKYIYDQTPRIVALAQSAPKYDELTKPASVPVPAACISTSHSCRCYTQQGTAYPISAGMCADIVAHGYFQEFDPDGGVKKQMDKVAQNEYRAVSPDAVPVSPNVFSLDSGSAGSSLPVSPAPSPPSSGIRTVIVSKPVSKG